MNELQERRVIRLLSDAADAVDSLPSHEVGELLDRATLGVTTRRRTNRHARDLLAAAAAAAVLLGTTLAAGVPGSQHSPSGAARTQLDTFPEGSALHLLLARAGDAS